MLKTENAKYHKVRQGQSVKAIARYYSCAERLIVRENSLRGEPFEGQILKIPAARGDLYTALDGEGRTLLCGSKEKYEEKNGTSLLYPGMEILL